MSEERPPMTLIEALGILSRVHTRDDDQLGYVVMMGASPEYDGHRYIEAWGVVRQLLGGLAAPPFLTINGEQYTLKVDPDRPIEARLLPV